MKLYRHVQFAVEEFWKSGELLRVIPIDPSYANPHSARSSYYAAIKRLRYNIAVRLMYGDLYLIRIKEYH